MELPELQAMADMTAKHIGLAARPRVELVEGGDAALAYLREDRITIPSHFQKFGQIWMTYYVAHEVCHFHPSCVNHRKSFRDLEEKALAFWRIKIKREHGNDAYPSKITRI